MISAKRTNDPDLSDQENRQPIHDVTVVAAIKGIADGIEALTGEIRRLAQDHIGSAAIDVNRMYSRAEVARLLIVSVQTVDRRIRAGTILSVKSGSTVRIDGASLNRHRTGEQLIAARRVLKL